MKFLSTFLAASFCFFIDCSVGAAELPPNVSVEHGALVWVRHVNAIVPYASRAEKSAWQDEKQRFLAELPDVERSHYGDLRRLSFEEFQQLYFYDQPRGVRNFSGRGLPVGHVGIVQKVGNELYIIEATINPRRGVFKSPLRQWLSELDPKEHIWLGRFRGISSDQIAEVVRIADAQVGKPYEFFNLDLGDDTSFYCSKLIWHAFFKATGLALDGNKIPKRRIWYSPKQMHRSEFVDVYHGGAAY